MKVLLLGATGMVGQGVLRECLLDPDVQLLQTVGRTPSGRQHPKLREIVHQDLWRYSSLEADLAGFDACFFCLGASSAGMKEADYERVTYGIAMAAAETLSRLNPRMTFIYVSGAGADSSEQGRSMWARVKGKTENALMRLPFKAAYMFRPGIIEPLYGVKSKTASYRFFYTLSKPLLPALRRVFPAYVLTTEQIGRAMLAVARHGAPKRVLEIARLRVASSLPAIHLRRRLLYLRFGRHGAGETAVHADRSRTSGSLFLSAARFLASGEITATHSAFRLACRIEYKRLAVRIRSLSPAIAGVASAMSSSGLT